MKAMESLKEELRRRLKVLHEELEQANEDSHIVPGASLDPLVLVIDDYDLEEHPRFPDIAVARFRNALWTAPGYREVARVHYTPSILGIPFPIDGSPHDWRYPAHDLTIFAVAPQVRVSTVNCFPTLDAARRALYTGTRST